MKRLVAWLGLVGALFVGAPGPAVAADEVAVPPLRSAVTDLTGTLSPSDAQQLEARLQAFSKERGSQIAVLIVPTTQPESIEQFSIRVAEAWKIGRGGKDDGVILLVAKNDRALRVEVGYGLEGAIPDALAHRIVDEVVAPRFKQSDFAGGINAGVDGIMKLIQGENLPAPAAPPGGLGNANPHSFFTLIVVFFVATALFNALFGRIGGATLGGGVVGLVAWFLFGSVLFAVVAAVVGAMFGLFRGTARGPFGGIGGGWGGGMGGGGFGGGGGGFSGGGGGFGGGGASGRW